jgi:hypothetical protein
MLYESEDIMSEPIVVLENQYATVWYHPDGKIVHHQFHKFIYGEAFRSVLNSGAEIFEKYGAQKWLSDDRNNSALPADDAKWATEVWNPRVRAAGWKYWAIVMPEKVVGQMNMQRFIQISLEMGVIVRVFSTPDEALAWLKNPETVPTI